MKEVIINVIDFVLYLRRKNQSICSDTELIYSLLERFPYFSFDEISKMLNERLFKN